MAELGNSWERNQFRTPKKTRLWVRGQAYWWTRITPWSFGVNNLRTAQVQVINPFGGLRGIGLERNRPNSQNPMAETRKPPENTRKYNSAKFDLDLLCMKTSVFVFCFISKLQFQAVQIVEQLLPACSSMSFGKTHPTLSWSLAGL